MSTTRSMKITFQGETRDVSVPMPTSLAGLQEAISSTFSADLPPRSEECAADGDLRFTYSDPEGDAIVFDKESELNLALRLCPMLEISAAPKAEIKEASNTPQEADNPDRIYNVATRNLRQNHGVPHMTPVKLMKTLTLLKLGPRCLVVQGLAPRKLLAPAMKNQRLSPGGKETNDQDLADSACMEVEEMTLEDEEKEDNSTEAAVGKSPTSSPSSKMPIRDALLAADVRLPPDEVKPLLSALGVPPAASSSSASSTPRTFATAPAGVLFADAAQADVTDVDVVQGQNQPAPSPVDVLAVRVGLRTALALPPRDHRSIGLNENHFEPQWYRAYSHGKDQLASARGAVPVTRCN